jgi:hypothetical protein
MTPTHALFLYCSGLAGGAGFTLLIIILGGWL